MSIKESIKGFAKSAASKARQTAEKAAEKVKKAATSNLKQTKELLKTIPASNISGQDKSMMSQGVGLNLVLHNKDFVDFANEKPGNVLLTLDKMGELLATSLLTKTTTNKLNDFKDVYYSSKEAMEKFGNKLYMELKNSDESGNKSGDSYEQLEQLLKNGDADGCLDVLSNTVYKNVADEKIKKKKQENFKKVMKSHLKNIDKNLNIVQKTLRKNKALKSGISELMGELPKEEIIKGAEDILEKNVELAQPGFKKVVDENYRTGFDDLGTIVLSTFTSAAGLGFLCLSVWLSVLAPELIPVSIFGAGCMLTLAVVCILGNPNYQKRKFIRNFKNDCNKIKQSVSKVFKAMREARKYTIGEMEGETDEKQDDGELSEDCKQAINDFVEKIRNIWKQYADSKKRKYGYFKHKEELFNLEIRNEENKKTIQSAGELLLYLSVDIKGKISVIHYSDMNDYARKKRRDIVESKGSLKLVPSLCHMYNSDGVEYDVNIETLKKELKNAMTYLKKETKQNEEKIAELEKIDEGENGLGRSKEKTSSMGLFKDGFAKTLANCTYE